MPASARVRQVLLEQQDAWNRGDIDGFMQGYWQDAALRFDSGPTTTYGWQATLDHYRQRYPDRAAMGVLGFSHIDVQLRSPETAEVTGEWSLKRAADQPHGSFDLEFHHFDDGWKIVHDHTESAS